MGWMDSVPYFCSPTETVANIANSKPTNVHQLPHPLKKLANTLPPDRADTTPPTLNPHVHDSSPIDTIPPVLRPYQKPTRFYDIFIDDYIMGVQGTPTTHLQHLRWLLHSINEVFRPVDELDDPIRNHVPSIKKLLKGDAYLDTLKIILGWILDTPRHLERNDRAATPPKPVTPGNI
jgi:hypothetical protein